MAYPDMGHFKMPIWTFENDLSPEELAAEMERWRTDLGVTIVGGCCGLGLDYIRALAA
jgi:methionine synthase I (cobalamin-dependent)